MKREIKLRGMDARVPEDSVHWVYGAYVKHLPYTPAPIGTPKISDSDYEYAIVNDAFSDWQMPRDLQIIPIRPNTVGQYTGLRDKNGMEIYEGDLFEHKFGYTVFDDPPHAEMGTECGVVTFDNGQFVVSTPGWGGRNLYELLLLNGYLNDMPDSDLFTMKVVGNKFENPELLEGKQ